MKTLIWKFRYARHMMRRADVPFLWAWGCAGASLECFGIDDMNGPDAADEEMSNWSD